MAVIALVALVVIGPKELPQAMRAASKWVRKARSLAREFQSGVDDMIREADLDDARKAVESTRNLNLDKAFEETVDPTGGVRAEVGELDRAARDGGADGESSGKQAPKDEPEATIAKHPHTMAPAHSVAPPREEVAAGAAAGDQPKPA